MKHEKKAAKRPPLSLTRETVQALTFRTSIRTGLLICRVSTPHTQAIHNCLPTYG